MATYHCQIKPARQVSAVKHADYVECEGRYKKKGEELEYKESGNMPEWAKDNPKEFWRASDELERKNATRYREIEVALPRELTKEQRIELARDFVAVELKNHTYTFAIHNTMASDGKKQPHAHIMFCERTLDGVEREREKYFSRPSTAYRDRKTGEMKPADPSKGGTKKADRWCGTSPQKARNVKKVRERWATMTNRALERAEKPERVDHRSLADQGIDRVAMKHRGPVATAMGNRFEETNRHAMNRSIKALNQSKELSKQLAAVKLEHATAKGEEIKATAEVEAVKRHAAQIKVVQEQQKPVTKPVPVVPVSPAQREARPLPLETKTNPLIQQPYALDVQPVQLTMTGAEISKMLYAEECRIEEVRKELKTYPASREDAVQNLIRKHVPGWSRYNELVDKAVGADQQCQQQTALWRQQGKENKWSEEKGPLLIGREEYKEWKTQGESLKEWRTKIDTGIAKNETRREELQKETNVKGHQINAEADQIMQKRGELEKDIRAAYGCESLRHKFSAKDATVYAVKGKDITSLLKDEGLTNQIKERKEREKVMEKERDRSRGR